MKQAHKNTLMLIFIIIIIIVIIIIVYCRLLLGHPVASPSIPDTTLSLPYISPHSIITPYVLLSCLNITPCNFLTFFTSNGGPKEKSSKEDNSLSRTHSSSTPTIFPTLSQVLMQQPIWKSTKVAVNLKAWTSTEFAAHTLIVLFNTSYTVALMSVCIVIKICISYNLDNSTH